MTNTRLEEVKKQLAKKRPKFARQDSFKKKRIAPNWRKPRGLQSKMRLEKKGYRKKVKTGFGSPKALRDTYAGEKIIIVNNLDDIKKLEKGTIIIGSNVGLKKKIEMIDLANKKKLTIFNLKEDFAKEKTKALNELRAKKIKIKAERSKKAKKKSAKKKETKDAPKTDEEKKKETKKELDKLLTKKNSM